jgi:hypothetical protein
VPKIGRFFLRLRGYCTYTPLREAALKIFLPQGKSPLRKNGQNNKPGFCLGRRNLAPFAGRLHSISGVLQTQTQTPTPFPQPSLRQTQNTHPHTNSTPNVPPTLQSPKQTTARQKSSSLTFMLSTYRKPRGLLPLRLTSIRAQVVYPVHLQSRHLSFSYFNPQNIIIHLKRWKVQLHQHNIAMYRILLKFLSYPSILQSNLSLP